MATIACNVCQVSRRGCQKFMSTDQSLGNRQIYKVVIFFWFTEATLNWPVINKCKRCSKASAFSWRVHDCVRSKKIKGILGISVTKIHATWLSQQFRVHTIDDTIRTSIAIDRATSQHIILTFSVFDVSATPIVAEKEKIFWNSNSIYFCERERMRIKI